MASDYRNSSQSRFAQQRAGQRFVSEMQQRKKPASEKTLARLRSAQRRLPDKRSVAWVESVNSSVGDDAWPVMDELLNDWMYEET